MLKALLAPAFVAAMAVPANAEKLTLDQISAYLNQITTLEAPFQQINDDGSVSTGRLMIKRPGKMRFEYNPPVEAVVLASANTVAIFDGKSNQPPETYPLKRTPLSLILLPNVDLKAAKMVVGHEEDEEKTIVTAMDPKHPDYGTIKLTFTANPIALREWTVFDATGLQTQVLLGEAREGQSYPNTLFNIHLEKQSNDR